MLQEAAAIRLEDYFEFLIGEAREELDGAPGGGSRYPVQARMDGREFARFHVDVGIGDEVLEPLDIVTGEDWLGFAGVKSSSFPGDFGGTTVCGKAACLHALRGESASTHEQRTLSIWSCWFAEKNWTKTKFVPQSRRRSKTRNAQASECS